MGLEEKINEINQIIRTVPGIQKVIILMFHLLGLKEIVCEAACRQ